MTNASPTNEYLLLMRSTTWDRGLSPREAQDGLEALMSWIDGLRQRGILKAGQPLAPAGSIVSADKDGLMDGPFIESKEAVGGYLLIDAASAEAAVELTKECPVLHYGMVIEVRPVLVQCPMLDNLGLTAAGSAPNA